MVLVCPVTRSVVLQNIAQVCKRRETLLPLVSLTVLSMNLHTKCRNRPYPDSSGKGMQRLFVPDEKVSWSVQWPDYKPPSFTLPGMESKPWADSAVGDQKFSPKWNSLDGSVDRRSHQGEYEIADSYPLNPAGRTGLQGRGYLGRWGPNHAADPVVTRWKRDNQGNVVTHEDSKLPILQFISIQRKDSGEWAIPGGMIDPGEVVTATLKREFCEEAMNSLSLSSSERSRLENALTSFFSMGQEVYRGYVDDPRNTDNAWMETVVYNFHDENGDTVGKFPLEAGDDAAKVRWTDICKGLKLYASHAFFISKITDLRKANW